MGTDEFTIVFSSGPGSAGLVVSFIKRICDLCIWEDMLGGIENNGLFFSPTFFTSLCNSCLVATFPTKREKAIELV